MTASADFQVRRVGFSSGTDEELTALHAVEAPVAAERGSNRMPHPIESYIAFARALPSDFDEGSGAFLWCIAAVAAVVAVCGVVYLVRIWL